MGNAIQCNAMQEQARDVEQQLSDAKSHHHSLMLENKQIETDLGIATHQQEKLRLELISSSSALLCCVVLCCSALEMCACLCVCPILVVRMRFLRLCACEVGAPFNLFSGRRELT